MEFNFIASENFDLDNFKTVENFVEAFPDFQTVILQDENELRLLFQLMGLIDIEVNDLSDSEFFEMLEYFKSKTS